MRQEVVGSRNLVVESKDLSLVGTYQLSITGTVPSGLTDAS